MTLRLGEVLIRQGLLTPEQVEQVLDLQRTTGGAFGEIAERLFGLHPADVESAWAEQYASIADPIDPRTRRISDEAKALVSSRQAWQFSILPIRIESGEAVFCTTRDNLPRALRFVYRSVKMPCYFLLADEPALADALAANYPAPGMRAPREALRISDPQPRRAG